MKQFSFYFYYIFVLQSSLLSEAYDIRYLLGPNSLSLSLSLHSNRNTYVHIYAHM